MNVCTDVRFSDSAFDSIAKEYGASSPAEINLIKTEVREIVSTYSRTYIYYLHFMGSRIVSLIFFSFIPTFSFSCIEL